jgi:outer membrane immunogenic protein
MRIRVFAVLAIALASTATVAQAEAFNGPYIGAQIGWQQDRFSATLNEGFDQITGSENSDGFSYGAFLGYDFNINGNGVIGVEGAISGSTNKLGDEEEDGAELRSGRTIELVARAGALISNQTLIFARGGYSNARFTVPISENLNVGSTRDGWTLGAGIEHAFSPNVSGRFEYAYSQYGRLRSAGNFEGEDFDFSVRPTRHALKAGVAFHF